MDNFTFAIALTFICFGHYYVRGDDDALVACMRLMKPEYGEEMCCESLKGIEKFVDEIKYCNTKGSSEELMCANFECFLNKQGLLKGDKIDNEKAKAFFDGIIKDNPKDKNVMERVKEECLDGQYEEYEPDEECGALKFYVCIYTNIMMECNTWKDTKNCKEASDLAKKCKEAK